MIDNDDLYLLTPGPVNVHWKVLSAGSRPMIHHRTAEFSSVLEKMLSSLKAFFSTCGDVLLVHTTGRGAIEGAFLNLLEPNAKVLSVCNGRFGQMFAEIGECCSLAVHRVHESWEEQVDLDLIDQIISKNPDIQAVTLVHSDTSNGLVNPVAEIGRVVRKHDRLFLVDCISSLCAMEFQFDDWCVDMAVTSSQKGLMAPPGISFVALSERAWERIQHIRPRSYYIQFKKIRDIFSTKKETPGTTPVSLVMSVNASLMMMMEEGLKNVYRRHSLVADMIRRTVEALGLRLFPQGNHFTRSNSVTAIQLPEPLTPSRIREILRRRYGIMVSGGLGPYKDRVIRVGHIGTVSVREALLFAAAMECTLMEEGFIQHAGYGLEAAYTALKKNL